MKRFLSIILALCMILAFVPAHARAEDELPGREEYPAVQEAPSEPEETPEEAASPEAEEGQVLHDAFPELALDNDALLAGYVQALFDGRAPDTLTMAQTPGDGVNFLPDVEEKLDPVGYIVEQRVKAQIEQIAAGNRTDTVITVDTDDLDMSDFSFATMRQIYFVLLKECTYELYWHDVRYGFTMSYGSSFVEMSFYVAEDYRGDQFTVNPEKIQSAQTAAANARAVVAQYASASDLEKLHGYFDAICARNTYNDDAAANVNNRAYGTDPWQLVYVFDGDPETNVVCEGYAKSFEYLCNQTVFQSSWINCWCVSGDNHMWNLITMDDGRNYVMDVTWSDGGDASNDAMFLSYAVSGSPDTGYELTFGSGTTLRRYDYSEMRDLYSGEDLFVADSPYVQPTSPIGGSCGENMTWELSGDRVLTIRGTGEMDDYSTDDPAPWSGRKVRALVIEPGVTATGYAAFQSCSKLAEVTLPETLERLGGASFLGCSGLTCIDLPDSLREIGMAAFESSGLTEISIPAGVESIGVIAFDDCRSLRAFHVDAGNTVFSSDASGVLFNKAQTELIEYPVAQPAAAYAIPESVTGIRFGAFSMCRNLQEVTIPASVTQIENNNFFRCGALSAIQVDAQNPAYCSEDGVLFDRAKTTLIAYPVGNPAAAYRILDGVTTIGRSAFFDAKSLTELTIPVSVTAIEWQAFEGCTALQDIYYGGTEEQWEQITQTNISYYFQRAQKHFCEPHSVAEGVCGDNLTWTLDSGGRLTVSGEGSMEDYTYDNKSPWDSYIDSIEAVVIESGVTSIGSYAFYDCRSLTRVTIAEGVSSIGFAAFSSCEILTSVTLPEGVTSIGASAFSFCSNLTRVTIPGSVTSIGSYAFSDCLSLTSVTIPEGVTSIEENTFESCESLTSVTIPGSVTSIGDYAFFHCISLTDVTILEGVASIGHSAFCYCESLTNLTIPESVTSIGFEAFQACDGLTSVTIPGSVTSIANEAFQNCINLASLTIQEGVTSIGEDAFEYCWSLASVTIPESVTSIGRGAFYNCASLADVWYGGTQEQWDAITIGASNDPLLSAALHVTEPVIVPPTYVEQPQSVEVTEGETATFTVVAEGTDLQYQWYRRPSGSTWSKLAGETEPTLTVTASAKLNGYQYRCKITNTVGSVYSAIATLSVRSGKPVITLQPADVTVAEGKTATFRVAASGSGLSYQWYSKMGTGAWSAVSGATSATLTVTAEMKNSGRLYRCRVKNEAGSPYSSSATLTVTVSKPKITEHPQPVTVYEGKTATFHVAASGSGLRYQWYSKLGNGAWSAISGKTTDTLTVTATAKNNGKLYRCKVSNSAGGVYSGAAEMTVIGKPVITQKPASVTVVEGQTAEFTVAATGENLRYQWYTKIGTGAWSAMSGKTTDTLTVTALLKNNGRLYRCRVINDAGGVYSGQATLTVLPIGEDDETGWGGLHTAPAEPGQNDALGTIS